MGFCTEGHKAEGCNFEELLSERDSDDGDAPDTAANQSSERNFPSEKDYPEDIEKGASESRVFIRYFFFERERTESRDFETLDSCGNSDYAYAKEQTGKSPFQPEDKSAENEPEDISQSFHSIKPFYIKIIYLIMS